MTARFSAARHQITEATHGYPSIKVCVHNWTCLLALACGSCISARNQVSLTKKFGGRISETAHSFRRFNGAAPQPADQLPEFLEALLANRFKPAVHHEVLVNLTQPGVRHM
jgi:hypothetical protein